MSTCYGLHSKLKVHTQRQRGDTNAQTDGDRSKNDHSGTTDELFGRVDTQQMEGQQWRRQIANPLPKKYQLLSARQKYSVSVIVVCRSPDYRFDEPFLPITMEVSGWGGQSTYAAGRLDPRFPPLGRAGNCTEDSTRPKTFVLPNVVLLPLPWIARIAALP